MDGLRLGEDDHGVWVGCPAGTVGQRGTEPPVTWDTAYVVCFPREAWWTALFNAPPRWTELYCDISTVPEWRGDEVTMVDLDLDVLRRRDGTVEVVDEDEFAEHQVRYGYSRSVIERAQESCDRLAKAAGDGTEPFATAFRPWLDRTVALS
jgi:hypothetical protein